MFESSRESCLGTIVGEVTSDTWIVTVKMDEVKLKFKLDNGADVTVIKERLIPLKQSLQKVTEILWSRAHKNHSAREAHNQTQLQGKPCSQDVYVENYLEELLLG